jgi:2-polyprenyl-3-methyl-5-hydroxy-6-metoxy-1,4-benzoquinol methylase
MNHAYKRNYDQIARDHIRHWRITGRNPFQEQGAVERNENETFELLKQYVDPGDRILDAGCGMGDMLLRLEGYDAVGIDLSAEYVEVCHERGLQAQVGRVEKLPWPRDHFDMVICTDVLEHVLDLNKAVRELLRVLKPGGTLIVRTPNQENLAFDTPPYEFVHLRRFDYQTFQLLFRKIFGCEVLETVERPEVINVAVRK